MTARASFSYECPKCHFVSYNANDIANFYCIRCHQSAEDLRLEQVTDFKHITSMYLDRRDCFTLAFLTLADLKDPQARLVHGLVINSFTGKLTEHAWVEVPAIGEMSDGTRVPITAAIDHTQIDARSRIVPTTDLYPLIGARDLKRFTMAEALVHAARFRYDGPWPGLSPMAPEA